MSSSIVRWLSGLLASVMMVAGVSALVAFLNPRVLPLHLLVLYLLVIMPVAIVWGTGLAVVTAVLSAAVYAFMFLPPLQSFRVDNSRSVVALSVFLVTAVVVGELAARLRRAALESARLSEEQSALRRVATLVAPSAAPSTVFEAVTREVGLLCGADLARMERYEQDGTVTGVAAWNRVPDQLAVGTRFDLDGPSVARDVRQTGAPVRLESFAGATGGIAGEAHELGIRSSVGCPIVVAGRLWGVIAASTRSDEAFPANTESQIASSPSSSPPPSRTRRAKHSSRPHVREWSPQEMRPGGVWSGTCTTERNNGSSHLLSNCASPRTWHLRSCRRYGLA